jgi:hypothetical protein
VADLISVCGEKGDRNLRKAWAAKLNGLITIPSGPAAVTYVRSARWTTG